MPLKDPAAHAAYKRERYAKDRAAQLSSKQRLRLTIIENLGGVCVRCGWADVRALDIDHIDGGGNKERAGRGPVPFWRRVLLDMAEGRDPRVQLLCANCHRCK